RLSASPGAWGKCTAASRFRSIGQRAARLDGADRPQTGSGRSDMFLFKMRDADGNDLGTYNSAIPGPWRQDDLLYEEGWAKWRISAVRGIDDESETCAGIFEV